MLFIDITTKSKLKGPVTALQRGWGSFEWWGGDPGVCRMGFLGVIR